MRLRVLLVALITISTVAFVIGTTIERNSKHEHHESTSEPAEAAPAGESAEHRKAEGLPPESSTSRESTLENEELKPLGIDIEAAPFVALAVAVSLGLALAAWLRPRWLLLLIGIAAAMLLFAALDVREIFHQSDESRTGLALLAGVVAALHLGAAIVAGLMGREAGRTAP